MRFFIYSPEYRHTSCGIRMLYRLTDILREKGYATQLLNDINFDFIFNQDDVVIYPEVVPGNPWKAANVIRWALNKPGALSGDTFYPESELVFYYADYAKEATQKATKQKIDNSRKLFLWFMEPYFKKDDTIKDDVVCYVGKYTGEVIETPEKAKLICTGYPQDNNYNYEKIITTSREGTAEVLKQAKILYSYDDNTAILQEAEAVGCKVYVLNNRQWVKYDKYYNGEHPYLTFDYTKIDKYWNDTTSVDNMIKIARQFFKIQEKKPYKVIPYNGERKQIIVIPAFCKWELLEYSIKKLKDTATGNYELWVLLNHYPTNEEENTSKIIEISKKNKVNIWDSERDRGLHGSINYFLENHPQSNGTILIVWDPKSEINNECIGWNEAMMNVLTGDDSIGIVALWQNEIDQWIKHDWVKLEYKEIKGIKVAIHPDIQAYKTCGFNLDWITSIGGFGQVKEFWGGFETYLHPFMKRDKIKLAYLPDYMHSGYRYPKNSVDPDYEEWKLDHWNGYQGSFAAWIKDNKEFNPETDPRLRVLFLSNDKSGCRNYRVEKPAQYMNKSKFKIKLRDHLLKDDLQYHIWVIQKVIDKKIIPNIEVAKKCGIKVVYEIDDDMFNIDKYAPSYNTYTDEVKKTIEDIIRLCDAVIVSTDYLAKKMRQYNENVYICKNSLDFSLWNKFIGPRNQYYQNKNNDIIKIGWMGSSTHLKDITFVINPLINILTRFRNVRFKCVGWNFTEYKNFETIRDRIEVDNVWKPFDSYGISMIDFDIGIAPLMHKDLEFNRSKSNIKWLEYSYLGIPTIATNCEAYEEIEHDKTGLLVGGNNQKNWIKEMEKLIKFPSLRKQIAENAKEYVIKNYNQENHSKTWEFVFYDIMKDRRVMIEAA